MIEALRIPLRIVVVCALVLFCGATTCYSPSADVQYAKGYGYIVKVHRNAGVQDTDPDEDIYYVFDTEDDAHHFVKIFYTDRDAWNEIRVTKGRSGQRISNLDDPDKFDQITSLLRPVPPPPLVIDTELPLGNPQLPEPIPQTPQ